MECEDEQLQKRRRQIREASKRLRKRRRDQQTALEAEVAQLRQLVDELRRQLRFAQSELALARPGNVSVAPASESAATSSESASASEARDATAGTGSTNAALVQRVQELEAEVARASTLRELLRDPSVCGCAANGAIWDAVRHLEPSPTPQVSRFISELSEASSSLPAASAAPRTHMARLGKAEPTTLHLGTATDQFDVPVHEEGQRMAEWLLMEAAQVQMPRCECPKLEPVAIVDGESLRLAAVDAIHHVSEFLSQGWSHPTQGARAGWTGPGSGRGRGHGRGPPGLGCCRCAHCGSQCFRGSCSGRATWAG